MGITRWLKIQYVEPQYNKSIKMIAYYKMIINDYETRYDVSKFTGRRKGTYEHAERALAVWEHKKENLSRKLEMARRMER